jgi:hypothetical protein
VNQEPSDPPDLFETWLRLRLADVVENGEVPASLLTNLHAALADLRTRPPEARHTLALMELADRVHLPVDRLAELLAALGALPAEAQDRLRRRFVEAWLMHHREAYESEQKRGNDGPAAQ